MSELLKSLLLLLGDTHICDKTCRIDVSWTIALVEKMPERCKLLKVRLGLGLGFELREGKMGIDERSSASAFPCDEIGLVLLMIESTTGRIFTE